MVYKFQPSKPFSLYKPELGQFNKDSRFLDDMIREHIDMGGVQVNVYRLRGIFPQTRNELGLATDPGEIDPIDIGSFLGIQDPILNENRDREYDFDDVPVLKGSYQVSQNDLEYAKWGLSGLTGDVITMEFHLNHSQKVLGRRFIVGDVVEMPHLREVSDDGRAKNKWYEVASVVRSPSGFDPMYAFHVLGIILRPMRDAQEFTDLLEREDQYGKTLKEQASNHDAMMNVVSANQQIAGHTTKTTWWDLTPLYVDPTDEKLRPYRFTDDAIPPNGVPVQQGMDFPPKPAEFDYFVRTDFAPNRLFQYYDGRWHTKEVDHKREWQPYNWVSKLREFMTDRSTTDEARPWDLKSIHDVATNREANSNPSYDDEPTTTEASESPTGDPQPPEDTPSTN